MELWQKSPQLEALLIDINMQEGKALTNQLCRRKTFYKSGAEEGNLPQQCCKRKSPKTVESCRGLIFHILIGAVKYCPWHVAS